MTFFGSDTFERRRAAACKFLAANHLRAVIIGPGPEFEYLTGTQIDTHERLSAIVLTDEGNATVVLPSTDAGSFPSDDPALIPIGWRDGEDPYEIVYKLIASPADSATPPIIGLGSTLTADHVLALQRYRWFKLQHHRLFTKQITSCSLQIPPPLFRYAIRAAADDYQNKANSYAKVSERCQQICARKRAQWRRKIRRDWEYR